MGSTKSKRVLIVDDERNIARFLADSLKRMGHEYHIDTAYNAQQALDKLREVEYELLLTDYMMPGMSGVDLIEATRQISPRTRAVLMTAYGDSEQMRRQLQQVELAGYVDKPFSLNEIRQIVKDAFEYTSRSQEEAKKTPAVSVDKKISEALNQLQANTSAASVLLVNANGNPIEEVGHTAGLDVYSVAALVAANFLAAAELSNLLGNKISVFKSSYHEGSEYNIYSYDVNGEVLLTVVFGPQVKPGLVWFYTKQTAESLRKLVEAMADESAAAMELSVDSEFAAELSGAFDNAFN